jgi:peptidoglycan/xylan/chitin deacetylase (PgdA/CDA1 family)/glycosyltransferase involved in cell wall biosynthesis
METEHCLQVRLSLSGVNVTAPLRLSVVVPTHNRRDVLVSRTLPAIFGQDLPADEYEVIVVVDGSTDGTIDMLERVKPPCALRVLEQPQRGPSAARNMGIAASRGDLVLFLDDDIIPNPDVLRQHAAAHTGPEPLVAHGSIFLAPGTPASVFACAIASWYKNYFDRLNPQTGLKWPKDDYLISNSSLPRAALLACGGFDERLPAKEDYELGLRLWKRGVRFQYLPQAVAYEFYVKPSRYVLRNDGESFGKTEVLLCRKHPEYRPYSALAALGKTVWWKRMWQYFYVRLPLAHVGLLTPPIWICDKLCRFPAMQRIGHRLLGVGRGIVEFRSAAREAGSWKTLQGEFGMRLPVLLYHHVGPLRPETIPGLTVSPERFERQVGWLARRGYTGICPSDWVRWRREGKGLPDKPVLFTFDDGYADLVEHALPVLRRYGFGAAVYVVTGQLGGINAWDAARGFSALRLMTAEQIRHWATQGIEFGAHSRTHADLTTLSTNELTEEVVGSGKDLESLLGSRVVSFVYPYGYHNQRVDDCVRGAFDLAFLADDKLQGLNHLLTDPFHMRRTRVQANDTWVELECRARWGRTPLLKLRARLRLRSRFKRAVRFVLGPSQP